MVLIVVIGVLPGPFLDRIRPSVGAIDRNLQDQRGSMKIAAPVPSHAQARHDPGAAQCHQELPGKSLMNPQTAHEIVLQTLRILSPEILLLATAMAMMTLAPVPAMAAPHLVLDRRGCPGRGPAGSRHGRGRGNRDVRRGRSERRAVVLRPRGGARQRARAPGSGP